MLSRKNCVRRSKFWIINLPNFSLMGFHDFSFLKYMFSKKLKEKQDVNRSVNRSIETKE